ncbi:hypothetical protein IB269_19660 [Delftia sp. DLF01]|uniref:DUF7181 domain-containing protein n=1 Tax=Delftia sp. DLF01 TaxID=2769279 RepID=UPI0017857575|nr:hypothetical protein [Delftia sp. DLF01]MBD9583614.1 hypothetical protein [Delftia sp. DLF01]
MSTQNSTHPAVAALRLYEAAHEDLFVQCCSNPIKNAWGKEVNLAKLNIAHEAAGRALNASPALEAPAAPALDAKAIAEDVCQRVAELPDRDSPTDWPEAMLVTGPELINAVTCEIMQALAAAKGSQPCA